MGVIATQGSARFDHHPGIVASHLAQHPRPVRGQFVVGVDQPGHTLVEPTRIRKRPHDPPHRAQAPPLHPLAPSGTPFERGGLKDEPLDQLGVPSSEMQHDGTAHRIPHGGCASDPERSKNTGGVISTVLEFEGHGRPKPPAMTAMVQRHERPSLGESFIGRHELQICRGRPSMRQQQCRGLGILMAMMPHEELAPTLDLDDVSRRQKGRHAGRHDALRAQSAQRPIRSSR